MAAHQRDGHSSQAEKNIRRSTPGLVRTSMAGDRRFRASGPCDKGDQIARSGRQAWP